MACDDAILRNSCGMPIGLGLVGSPFLLIMNCLFTLSISRLVPGSVLLVMPSTRQVKASATSSSLSTHFLSMLVVHPEMSLALPVSRYLIVLISCGVSIMVGG